MAIARLPGTSVGITSPATCVVIAAASRRRLAAKCTLKCPQPSVAPVSARPSAGEFRRPRLEQIGGLEQSAAPFGRTEGRPLWKRSRGGIGGGARIRDRCGAGARRHVAGDRIQPREGRVVGGRPVVAADQQLNVFHDYFPTMCMGSMLFSLQMNSIISVSTMIR